jgi:hypothetical protein
MIAAALLILAQGFPQPQAPKCDLRARVIEILAKQFGEVQKSTGVHYGDDKQPASALEVYANDETGTWTVLMSLPNGMTCYVSDGRDWNDDITVDPHAGDDPA